MNTNDNMLTTIDLENNVKNKSFLILHSLFKEKGWYLIKNEMNWLSYTKFGDETSFFELKVLPANIIVSTPIKNSKYQFINSFNSFFEACEFIERKLIDYNN
jgi:hypothetical protein